VHLHRRLFIALLPAAIPSKEDTEFPRAAFIACRAVVCLLDAAFRVSMRCTTSGMYDQRERTCSGNGRVLEGRIIHSPGYNWLGLEPFGTLVRITQRLQEQTTTKSTQD
jgi:hypothetical protein